MATILVLETDPVSAALIEDRLHVAGHRTELADDPARALSAATEGRIDLVVLEMELPVVPGLEVIRKLRAQAETRSLPIVALSVSDRSADRVAALRAGADDYLTKPFDAEELLLRLDRLLGRRAEAPAVMQGDLESHPTWELVQYIEHAGKSGELVVHGSRGSGQMQVHNGLVVGARWQKLRGRDALLAMLDTKKGQFRLTTAEVAGKTSAADGFKIPEVLMQAAWLEDELAKRQEHLPATGAPLKLLTRELPTVDEDFKELPIEDVVRRLEEQPGARLYDLVHEDRAAPPKVRLAVAWLVEHGVVAPEESVPEINIMSTTEISSSMVLDLSVHNLLSAARDAGFDISALSCLLLMEPEVEPQLVELLEREPGFRSIPALLQLVEQLKLRHGGSADFVTEFGTLSLHVQVLKAAVKARIEAIIPACAGVMMWLDKGQETELIGNVIRRLETADGAPAGVLVLEGSPLPPRRAGSSGPSDAATLTAGTSRWRTTHHAPRSLIGVLRLLHPRTTSS